MTSTPLWQPEELTDALGIAVPDSVKVQRVVIDSRQVQAGDLFVALKGERTDGHAYVAQALAAGAVAALVTRAEGDGVQLVVPDTLQALYAIAQRARARHYGRVIGVTGSVGKTTMKEMLRAALSPMGKTYATQGNLNNHIGVPLTWANCPPDTEYVVIEMGMNHAGEITPLSELSRPSHAIITLIGTAHIEFFANRQGIADAKAEIFAGLPTGGTAVLNADNDFYEYLKNKAEARGLRVLSFGAATEATLHLEQYDAATGAAHIRYQNRAVSTVFQTRGRGWVSNALGATLLVAELGGDVGRTLALLGQMAKAAGRGEGLSLVWQGKRLRVLDDTYNASLESMTEALQALAAYPEKGRRIAILGDMLELGTHSETLHRQLADVVMTLPLDAIHTVGKAMQHLRAALPEYRRGEEAATVDALLPHLQDILQDGDIVLVKGSAGVKMGKIISALKES